MGQRWSELHTFIVALQIVVALVLIVLLAVQTDKAEQGGVMGIGGAGGRSTSDIDVAVGPERILKPLTKWMAIGFMFMSVLCAVPNPTIFHFIGVLVLYVAVMMYGDNVWRAALGIRR